MFRCCSRHSDTRPTAEAELPVVKEARHENPVEELCRKRVSIIYALNR